MAASKTAPKSASAAPATQAPVKKTPATKAPVTKAPAAKKAPAKKVPGKKAAAKKAPPVKPSDAAAPVAAPAPKVKNKLVRDSFTIPKSEYLVLQALKERAADLKRPVKKSELLRAGIAALQGLSDKDFLAAVAAVPSLKTGRPKGSDAGN